MSNALGRAAVWRQAGAGYECFRPILARATSVESHAGLAVMQAMLGKAATLVREPWSQVSIHDIAFFIAPLLCGFVGLRGLLVMVDVLGRTVTVSGVLRDAQHLPL